MTTKISAFDAVKALRAAGEAAALEQGAGYCGVREWWIEIDGKGGSVAIGKVLLVVLAGDGERVARWIEVRRTLTEPK